MSQHFAPDELFPFVTDGARAMVFVDGENLAMRYGAMLGGVPPPEYMTAWYKPDVAVWAQSLNPPYNQVATKTIRRYYFTSEQGTDEKRTETVDWLKSRGFQVCRVFRRDNNRRSKQVDISLCVDMLTHAMLHHYDVAVLVAGDEDYVPLVNAVQGAGKLVYVWALSSGLDRKLAREADRFVNLDPFFGV
jgi:hypothetical protein